MKKLTQENYNSIRDHLFDLLHKSGQNVKLQFPNTLRWAFENEAWKHFTDLKGQPFTNLVDWLHYMWPNGPDMGGGEHVLTYEDALKLTEKTPDVHRMLLEHAPKDKGGRPSKNGTGNLRVDAQVKRGANMANTATVLAVRLAQEKPRFYEAFMCGKYKTITAAAIAAKLISGYDDINLRRGKSAYRKMTPPQRREFLKWIKNFK